MTAEFKETILGSVTGGALMALSNAQSITEWAQAASSVIGAGILLMTLCATYRRVFGNRKDGGK